MISEEVDEMIKLMMRRGRVRTVEEVFFSLRSFSVFFLFISFIEKWFFFWSVPRRDTGVPGMMPSP